MVTEIDTRERLLDTALKLIWGSAYGQVSVDEICEKAGCKKGSFYHFFKSKADLSMAALEYGWKQLRVDLDRIFSVSAKPLERLSVYAKFSEGMQEQLKSEFGYVPGCPFASLGSEQCAEDDGLREKANEVLLRFMKYIESAVREAQQQGALPPGDAAEKTEQLYIYYTGVNALARLGNTLQPFERLWSGWHKILFANADADSKAANPRPAA